MKDRRQGPFCLLPGAPLLFAFFFLFGPAAATCVADQSAPVRAFLLGGLPKDHGKISKLFLSLKDAGADTVIAGPLAERGGLTRTTLPHVIFLAHQARLRLFVIVPTRSDEEALASHPEWEDRRYDIRSGTFQPAGKLDLFHPDALNYVMMTCKYVASFSVDGIVLGEDFSYDDTDGMSSVFLDAYNQRFKSELVPGKAFAKVEKVDGSYRVVEYGEGFGNFEKMKQERLGETLKTVMAASRKLNGDVRFAAPVPFAGLDSRLSALPEYLREVEAFRSADPDYFWLAFPRREGRGQNYKKGMETISRTAKILATAVKQPCKTILVIPLTDREGKLLSSVEIEEATAMAKKGGKPCIAYQVGKDNAVPATLTKKLFKEQQIP